jgi:hypothetical protein
MNDTNHILEELRSLRGAHVGLMTKMSDVCGEVRELVGELRHTQKSFDDAITRVAKVEREIHEIQLENATNRPILDIARSMHRSQWLTIFAAISAVAGTNLDKWLG